MPVVARRETRRLPAPAGGPTASRSHRPPGWCAVDGEAATRRPEGASSRQRKAQVPRRVVDRYAVETHDRGESRAVGRPRDTVAALAGAQDAQGSDVDQGEPALRDECRHQQPRAVGRERGLRLGIGRRGHPERQSAQPGSVRQVQPPTPRPVTPEGDALPVWCDAASLSRAGLRDTSSGERPAAQDIDLARVDVRAIACEHDLRGRVRVALRRRRSPPVRLRRERSRPALRRVPLAPRSGESRHVGIHQPRRAGRG